MLKNDAGEKISAIVEAAHLIENEELSSKLLDIAHSLRGMTLHGSMPSPSMLRDAARLFEDLGVKYAVIGGIAVSVHGQSRSTQNIDFLAYPIPPNNMLGDKEYMDKFGFYKAKSRTGQHVTIDYKKGGGGQIDILLAKSNIDKFALATAKVENVLNSHVKVVSPSALIGLKLQSVDGNATRYTKDVPDIISLLDKDLGDLERIKAMMSRSMLDLLDKIAGVRP